MTREDMAATLRPALNSATLLAPDKLRNSHHRIARLAAAGLRQYEIAERAGYSLQRVYQLLKAPAMQDLVARYRTKVDEAFERNQDEFYSLATSNMLTAERQIADRLEKADEEGHDLPIKELAMISRDAADRFGYGKKVTNFNINTDFAAMLEKAIARSGKSAEVSKVVEVEAEGGRLRRRV